MCIRDRLCTDHILHRIQYRHVPLRRFYSGRPSYRRKLGVPIFGQQLFPDVRHGCFDHRHRVEQHTYIGYKKDTLHLYIPGVHGNVYPDLLPGSVLKGRVEAHRAQGVYFHRPDKEQLGVFPKTLTDIKQKQSLTGCFFIFPFRPYTSKHSFLGYITFINSAV